MKTKSSYFNSIMIGGKKKAEEKQTPKCHFDHCNKPGDHKAPAGRNLEGHYLYFCLEHVREYNKNFNYFSDLSQEEIAKIQIASRFGDRPTWQTATNPNAKTKKSAASVDFAQIRSGSAAYQNRINKLYKRKAEPNNNEVITPQLRKYKILETKAFKTLGVRIGASASEIQSQYKILIKAHHPDANGGDRSSEERFREVLQAYKILKKAGLC